MELHEGCGRTKLFWLLAVADARTLKALVEYREGSARHRGVGTSGQCRFCGAVGSSGLLAIGNVCADQECQVCYLRNFTITASHQLFLNALTYHYFVRYIL